MTRIIGFDLDMTLIDSRQQIVESFQAVAEELKTPIDLEVLQARFGLKLEDELSYWFEATDIAKAAAVYRRNYIQLAHASKLLPGALDAIAAVRAAGDHIAVVTAKHASSAEPCLVATGLEPESLHAFVHGEEKAEVLRMISASAYVGDTPPDMYAAKSASVVGVGVATGAFNTAELLAAGATVALSSLVEFPDIYLSIVGP